MYIGNTLIQSDVFSNNTKFDEFVELLLEVVNTPAVDSNYRCIGRLMGGRQGVNVCCHRKREECVFVAIGGERGVCLLS